MYIGQMSDTQELVLMVSPKYTVLIPPVEAISVGAVLC